MSTNWVKRTTGVKCPGGEISNEWAKRPGTKGKNGEMSYYSLRCSRAP